MPACQSCVQFPRKTLHGLGVVGLDWIPTAFRYPSLLLGFIMSIMLCGALNLSFLALVVCQSSIDEH